MHVRFSSFPCVVLGLVCLHGSLARAQTVLYSAWNADSQTSLRKLDLGSGASQTVLLAGSSGNTGPQPWNFGPTGVAADVANRRMYYADISSHSISRINFDGTGKTDVVTGLTTPQDVAVDIDLASGKVYWTDTGTDQIRRANLDGSQVETVVGSGLLQATGLALDTVHHRLYWSDFHTDKIGSVNLDGTGLTTWSTPGGGAIDIVVDKVNQKLIWSDFDTYRIYRSNLDGTGIEVIVPTKAIDLPGSLAIDAERNQLYCVDWGRHALYRCDLNGANLTQVYSDPGFASFSGLAVIPEPSTVALAVAALVFCGRRSVRRRAV